MKLFLASIAVLLMVTGCFGPEPKSIYTKPEWVLHPEPGVLGMAYRHGSGSIVKQKEVAMQRAREELARQKGIDISLIETKSETYVNGKSTLVTGSEGSSKTKQTVSAHEKDSWTDPMSGIIYVWVFAD